MIDNFTPQPYPLEASNDGGTWSLVIGWKKDPGGNIVPLVALETGLTYLADPLAAGLRYRPADTRPTPAPPRSVPPAPRAARRERPA